MTRFEKKVVLVAGGTGGLGAAVADAFLGEGAVVAVTSRREDELARFRQRAGVGARLDGRIVDVTDSAAVGALVSDLVARHGALDVLVNTVGGYAGGKAWEGDDAVLDRMVELNLRSGWTLARAAVPAMLARGRGAVVNVAATAALEHGPGLAAYAASKAAAVAFVDSLAADLRGTGVRANSVLPHLIDTEANRKAMPDADFSKWPKPEEIACVILFLASDDAKLVHGAAIPV
jgi:NAD(P)-dependent dehydrogenase (short-subunit alcohol dehydrogenase family)